MREVVERLVDHQPSRTMLDDLVGRGRGHRRRLSTSCRMAGGSRQRRRAGGADDPGARPRGGGERLSGRCCGRSCRPCSGGRPPRSLAGRRAGRAARAAGDRVVTEVDRDGDAAAAVAILAGWVSAGRPAVTDLAWAAITLVAPADRPGAGPTGRSTRLRTAPASAVVALRRTAERRGPPDGGMAAGHVVRRRRSTVALEDAAEMGTSWSWRSRGRARRAGHRAPVRPRGGDGRA